MARAKEIEETVSEQPAVPAAPSIPVERLVAESEDFLGQPSFIAAGGLHGVEGELTVADAQKRIENWLALPVEEA